MSKFYKSSQDTILNYDLENIKSVYRKDMTRDHNIYAPFHIFATGSTDGNSVYIKPLRLLIDIGIPKKRYLEYDEDFFEKVEYIVITHHHGDHLNHSTLFYILENYPHIKVLTTDFLKRYVVSNLYKAKRDKETGNVSYPFKEKFEKIQHRLQVITTNWYTLPDQTQFKMTPRLVKHGDIINVAIQVYYQPLDLRLLYSTDLDNLDGETTFTTVLGDTVTVEGLNQNVTYNCMFLEANYDKEKLIQITQEQLAQKELELKETLAGLEDKSQIGQILNDYDRAVNNIKVRAENNKRHISEEEAIGYVRRFLSDDGIFIPMHASSTFGTFIH